LAVDIVRNIIDASTRVLQKKNPVRTENPGANPTIMSDNLSAVRTCVLQKPSAVIKQKCLLWQKLPLSDFSLNVVVVNLLIVGLVPRFLGVFLSSFFYIILYKFFYKYIYIERER
jgi:hypothetical protein